MIMCASLLTDQAPTKHKVRIYKSDISKLREEYNTIKECAERRSLGLDNERNNNDDRLLNNNIEIRSQNETLANARSAIAGKSAVVLFYHEMLVFNMKSQ